MTGRAEGQANVGELPTHPLALVTERQAALFLSCSPRTLRNRRSLKLPPRFVRIFEGRAIRYRLRDLEEFIAAGERSSTSDPGPNGAGR